MVDGWWCVNKGMQFHIGIVAGLYKWIYVVSANVVGVSYFGNRLVWAFWYFLISVVTLDVAIRDRDNRIRLSSLPIYIVLMVLMHPSGGFLSVYYGKFWELKDLYPFDFHMATTLSCIIVLWVSLRIEKWNLGRKIAAISGIFNFDIWNRSFDIGYMTVSIARIIMVI